jgi:hypothetical protein
MLEQYFLVLFVAVFLYWGWDFAKGLIRNVSQEGLCLYLVVKDQENCLEGIVRNLFSYLHNEEELLRLILLVESSADQTMAIAQRLGRSFSFEVQGIHDLDSWLAGSFFAGDSRKALLDLRGKTSGLADARKIKQYISACKGWGETDNRQEGLRD